MQKGKIIFTGHFMEYFVMSIGLIILSIITLGIMLPYYMYWNFKYFFKNMEIEMYTGTNQEAPPTGFPDHGPN